MEYLKFAYQFLALSIVTITGFVHMLALLMIGENKWGEFVENVPKLWSDLFAGLKK